MEKIEAVLAKLEEWFAVLFNGASAIYDAVQKYLETKDAE